jgi:hypothetical protein
MSDTRANRTKLHTDGIRGSPFSLRNCPGLRIGFREYRQLPNLRINNATALAVESLAQVFNFINDFDCRGPESGHRRVMNEQETTISRLYGRWRIIRVGRIANRPESAKYGHQGSVAEFLSHECRKGFHDFVVFAGSHRP